mmetsp:Transcript_29109/g.48124  ORF Transcript_29109/g.48124 Transcript_29109/m.48124 type:complete len:134 (-) Transcript_29109:283-684(-)
MVRRWFVPSVKRSSVQRGGSNINSIGVRPLLMMMMSPDGVTLRWRLSDSAGESIILSATNRKHICQWTLRWSHHMKSSRIDCICITSLIFDRFRKDSSSSRLFHAPALIRIFSQWFHRRTMITSNAQQRHKHK